MAEFTIYHNPRCGKSRATLALLEESGIEELRSIVAKLSLDPEQLVRKGEEVYRTRYAGKQMSGEQWIEAMAKDPILIERPIVVRGERAVLGRPPENVKILLDGNARR